MVKKIFKMPVALFVVLLLGTVLASAALVTYLSNSATVRTNVNSPLETLVSEADADVWATFYNAGTMYGGETLAFDIQVNNRANATISGTMDSIVESDLGTVSCGDFTSMMFYDPGLAMWIDASPMCSDVSGTAVVSVPVVYVPLETEEYEVELTFNPAVVPTVYRVVSQVMV